LPKDKPIKSFEQLDRWIDGIWEFFYNEHEKQAKENDNSMLLNKFYDEGSFATLAVAWRKEDKCDWVAYGDSVVFHYSQKTGKLEHSFTRLVDFARPPILISCKDPLEEQGFRSGIFKLDDTSVVFAASDTLSHYILMMYELAHRDQYMDELEEERLSMTSNSQLLQTASELHFSFHDDVIKPLQKASSSEKDFSQWLHSLYNQGILDMDDFSLAFLEYDDKLVNKT
jgi:hypothetical protein